MPAAGFKFLSQDQVNQLNVVEGNGAGSSILARLLDNALDIAASEIPTGIPQANVSGLVSALAAKQDAAKLVVYTSGASVGGSASETLVVTGLLSSDTILAVTQKVAGANATALVAHGVPASDALPISWTADPGAGSVVEVYVKKA